LLASAARHGASTARHGASAARHGASTARHGASAARHGASTARHGDALTRALRRLYSKSPDVASPPAIMPRRVTLTTAHAPLTTALRTLTTALHPLTTRRAAPSRCGHSLDELIKLARAVGDPKRKAGQICRLGVLVPLRLVKGLFEVLVGFSVLALCLREAAEL